MREKIFKGYSCSRSIIVTDKPEPESVVRTQTVSLVRQTMHASSTLGIIDCDKVQKKPVRPVLTGFLAFIDKNADYQEAHGSLKTRFVNLREASDHQMLKRLSILAFLPGRFPHRFPGQPFSWTGEPCRARQNPAA